MSQALKDISVCDLTRVLAGPTCTQILGDLGASVIKVEQPGVGDITRTWGPPFEKDSQGNDTSESAYYLACNRNKSSVEIDISTVDGVAQLHEIISKSDVFVENFKTGTLKKFGFDYNTLKQIYPRLIYCSITGFGQTGPYAERPGYDFQIQGMSGLMSLNGDPHGDPLRAGISLADLSTGVYSATAILAALFQRTQTGRGQFIDMALFDCQMAMLSFAAQSYLVDSQQPQRYGNGHPNIVPYGAFKAQDGFIVIAIGTNAQFEAFCQFVGRTDIFEDPRFAQNKDRVAHRQDMLPLMESITSQHPRSYWIENMEKIGVPCGPVNSLEEAFNDPQAIARGLAQSIEGTPLKTVASPLRLSDSPVQYRSRPPRLGEIL